MPKQLWTCSYDSTGYRLLYAGKQVHAVGRREPKTPTLNGDKPRNRAGTEAARAYFRAKANREVDCLNRTGATPTGLTEHLKLAFYRNFNITAPCPTCGSPPFRRFPVEDDAWIVYGCGTYLSFNNGRCLPDVTDLCLRFAKRPLDVWAALPPQEHEGRPAGAQHDPGPLPSVGWFRPDASFGRGPCDLCGRTTVVNRIGIAKDIGRYFCVPCGDWCHPRREPPPTASDSIPWDHDPSSSDWRWSTRWSAHGGWDNHVRAYEDAMSMIDSDLLE